MMFDHVVPENSTRSGWSQLASAGVLIAEAAIATIVFSVFVSSSNLLSAKPEAMSTPQTAQALESGAMYSTQRPAQQPTMQ